MVQRSNQHQSHATERTLADHLSKRLTSRRSSEKPRRNIGRVNRMLLYTGKERI